MNSPEEKTYRSGYVAIVGRPNVGKSTLLNAILEERLAITTPKPQTTRDRILGVRHFDDGQVIFLDTPGIHKAKEGLNKWMVETALGTISEADVVYLMVEAGPEFIGRKDLGEGNRHIIDAIHKQHKPLFLVINKVDLADKGDLLAFMGRIRELADFDEIVPISALENDGVDRLLELTRDLMPEGPAYFPDDMFTDRNLRFIAAEIIREKTLMILREEVPYSLAVEVETFRELDEGRRIHIDALLIVERDSQKGIVIGKGGQTLRRIGEQARIDLEANLERPVGLKLLVRVKKDWTTDPRMLKRLGYK